MTWFRHRRMRGFLETWETGTRWKIERTSIVCVLVVPRSMRTGAREYEMFGWWICIWRKKILHRGINDKVLNRELIIDRVFRNIDELDMLFSNWIFGIQIGNLVLVDCGFWIYLCNFKYCYETNLYQPGRSSYYRSQKIYHIRHTE